MEPVFGLGNRLIMIASALRLAELYERNLVIIWSEKLVPLHEKRHFEGKLSRFLETNIPELDYPIGGGTFYIPKMETRRYCLKEEHLENDNIYVFGWTHFVLSTNDLYLEPRDLSSEMRTYLKRILRPTLETSTYIKDNYTLLSGEYLGIHCRGGAHISAADNLKYNTPSNIIFKGALHVLSQYNLNAVMLSGQDVQLLAELVDMFKSAGISVSHHILDRFAPVSPLGDNNTSNIFQAIADIILLSQSRVVLSTASSTFGAVASLCAGPERFLFRSPSELISIESEVFTGFGL